MLTNEDSDHKPGLSPVRPWKEFISPLTLPPFNKEEFGRRVMNNVLYFHMNHLVLSCFVIFINAIPRFLSKYLLYVTPFLVLMWWFLFFKNPGDYYNKTFNFRVRKNYIAIILTIIILWASIVISGNFFLVYTYTSISGIFVFLHSILRSNGPIKIEPIRTSEISQGFDPESIRNLHKDEKAIGDEKRDRQKQIRNRIREKYGLEH